MRFLPAFWALLCLGLAPAARATGETPAESEYRQAALAAQLDAVLPLIVPTDDLVQLGRQLATAIARQQRRESASAPGESARRLVSRPFVDDLRVIFAVADAEPAPLVSEAQLADWGIDARALGQRAEANLRRRSGTIAYKPVGKLPWLYVLDTADGYASSRLLLRDQWADLARRLGGRLVLGVPTRDIVVFTVDETPERLRQLRDTVQTIAAHQGPAVSSRLFQWTDDGWRPFE